MSVVRQALALNWPEKLYSDRHFLTAILAALPVWLLWGGASVPTPSWALFQVVVLAPVLEELAFRGGLQGALLERPWGALSLRGISYANLVTSVIFALMHLWSHPPLWALAVVVPSLVFGHLRERLASTWPGMMVHLWYNLGYVAVMAGG